MPHLGEIGQIREVGRMREEDELQFEWRIPNAARTLCGANGDSYSSADIEIGDDIECGLCLYPIITDATRRPVSGWLGLDFLRFDLGPMKALHVRIGIRGSEGAAEMEKEVEREFSGVDQHEWKQFCSISELVEQRDRLMPNGDLIFACVVKRPARASGGLSSDEGLVTYSYKELETATQNFARKYVIGEGGFGTVFKADVRGDVVAIKRLKDPVDKQFIAELKTLTKYKHKHLLSLLGCTPGPNCCLLYKYIPNGSLEDRLACEDRSKPLSWQTRLSIAYGSAVGINHLHTFCEMPVVHRDIKSANILLDENFVPKVGDFGLVRAGDSSASTIEPVTARCAGTRGYMPPEALLGDVSVKWDTFSFGVVLLELLTGLPPYNPFRKGIFLIVYMENCKDIIPKLDSKAKWDKKAAKELYAIAQSCIAGSKRSRPAISEILEDLRKLSLLS